MPRLLLLILCLSLTQVSCKKEGCTNVNAENFDSNANEDDESCILARAKFVGQFSASQTCEQYDDSTYPVVIVESIESDANLKIYNFMDIDRVFEATVSGDTFTFSETVLWEDGVLILDIAGEGTLNETGNINVEFVVMAEEYYGQELNLNCLLQLSN